jgi:DNA-binding HxlR family transcriptional regulator
VEYALTPLGCRAANLLNSIREWAQNNLVEVLTARANYDSRPAEPAEQPPGHGDTP